MLHFSGETLQVDEGAVGGGEENGHTQVLKKKKILNLTKGNIKSINQPPTPNTSSNFILPRLVRGKSYFAIFLVTCCGILE